MAASFPKRLGMGLAIMAHCLALTDAWSGRKLRQVSRWSVFCARPLAYCRKVACVLGGDWEIISCCWREEGRGREGGEERGRGTEKGRDGEGGRGREVAASFLHFGHPALKWA